MPDAKLRIDGAIYDVGMSVNNAVFYSIHLWYDERKWKFFTANEYTRTYTTMRDVLDDIQRITVAKVNMIDGEFSCEALSHPEIWKEYIDGDPELADVNPEDVFNEFIDALVKTSEHIERLE
jgi:hypothetical protein